MLAYSFYLSAFALAMLLLAPVTQVVEEGQVAKLQAAARLGVGLGQHLNEKPNPKQFTHIERVPPTAHPFFCRFGGALEALVETCVLYFSFHYC